MKARTLTWWRWRIATKTLAPLAPLQFVPLRVEQAAGAMDEESSWEVVSVGGDILRVRGGIGARDLAVVLAALKLGRR